ncbi:GSCFA family protein [Tangfeifania diversioriginum]|uniref:GSCFA family protein n=1 Tax=Tangfeifania diversioriginum TaxID=1168035 RepID=A0A1M6AD42_9BACT|nr:GSCFA domain-containing protein [Tangfeifania diversioriginum]SHI34301.1 GSCFA family protein [Tangfeifania diversioriginum]
MALKFQTEVEIPDFEWQTGYRKRNLFMGSCFTENIGGKMAALKYDVDINPFGILYNPLSVANALELLLQKKKFTHEDLFQHNGLWHSFYHHSRFSSSDANVALENINTRIETSAEYLEKAEFLFVTFGTAWVYEYIQTGQTVSNCHKIPAAKFKRFRLAADTITQQFIPLINSIRKINPGIKFIFTVSPIRHWKDGAVENQRSKATLLLAIDQLTKEFDGEGCGYFPSYEIVMDELRDYRFYAEDMIHLSEVAVKHIWEKFQHSLIDLESQNISGEVQKIANAMNHKPFNKFTNEHLRFLKQCLNKTDELQDKYPYIKLTNEKHFFADQVKDIEAKLKYL